MDEARARELLGDAIQEDGTLESNVPWVSWPNWNGEVQVDGDVTVEYLQAIIYWINNCKKYHGH